MGAICAAIAGAVAFGQDPPAADDYLRASLYEAKCLRWRMQPEEAIPIYQELLRSGLDRKDHMRVHVLLAQCYQSVDGEAARQTWREIRDFYPDDPVSLKAAHRLGQLYSSIIPRGLKHSFPDAVEQFEYILERVPAGSRMALLAHINLGQIHGIMRQREKALKHYQAIYDLDESRLVLPAEAADLPDDERERLLKPLKEQLARMRKWVIPRMVSSCRRARAAESIAALGALKDRYKDDPRVAEAVEKALKRCEPSPAPAESAEETGDTSSASFLDRQPPGRFAAFVVLAVFLVAGIGGGLWYRKVLPLRIGNPAGPSREANGAEDSEPANRTPPDESGSRPRRIGLLLLLAAVFLGGLTWGVAWAAKFWETEPDILPPEITSPDPGTYVTPGAYVTLTCDPGTDQDKWTDGQETGYDTDDMQSPVWSSSHHDWLGDVWTGTEVTWIAPDYPNTETVCVFHDDVPKGIDEEAGEQGTRNDQAGNDGPRDIHVVEVMHGVSLPPFEEPWQGQTRSSDVQETTDSMMIYPGWTTADYNDTSPWAHGNVFKVRAKLSHEIPPGKSVDVWFRLFDVNDPRWGGKDEKDSVDDDTETMSNDNYPEGDKGALLNDTADTVGGAILFKVTLTGDGGDTVDALGVITQPYPGNNWRFAASTRQAWLEGVYIDNSDGMTLKDSEGNTVAEGMSSPFLTCWRYLHVERDSMGAPDGAPPPQDRFGTLTGTSTNLTATVLTHTDQDWRPDDQLIGSLVDPDTSDTYPEAYIVTGSAVDTVTCADTDMTLHAQTNKPYAIATHDVTMPDDGPDTGLLRVALGPARITLVEDTGRNTPNVPFQRLGYNTSYRGTLPEHDKYWCVYIMAAYERSLDRDNDPDGEDGQPGSCVGPYPDLEPEWSFIYKETIRDLCEDEYPTWSKTALEQRAVNHECGHHFVDDDHETDDSCVMYGYASPTAGPGFCADCIKKIRHPNNGHP